MFQGDECPRGMSVLGDGCLGLGLGGWEFHNSTESTMLKINNVQNQNQTFPNKLP